MTRGVALLIAIPHGGVVQFPGFQILSIRGKRMDFLLDDQLVPRDQPIRTDCLR